MTISFLSESLGVDDAFYDHEPRIEKLSDHSPIIVFFGKG